MYKSHNHKVSVFAVVGNQIDTNPFAEIYLLFCPVSIYHVG